MQRQIRRFHLHQHIRQLQLAGLAENVFRQAHGAEQNRLQERHHRTVNFRTVAQRVDIRVAGAQGAIDLHAAVNLKASHPRQRRFRTQAGGGHYRINLNVAVAVKAGANAGGGLFKRLELRFQQQMDTHVGQAMLQATADFRRHQ